MHTLIQCGWVGAWDSAFLPSSQLVQEPHFGPRRLNVYFCLRHNIRRPGFFALKELSFNEERLMHRKWLEDNSVMWSVLLAFRKEQKGHLQVWTCWRSSPEAVRTWNFSGGPAATLQDSRGVCEDGLGKGMRWGYNPNNNRNNNNKASTCWGSVGCRTCIISSLLP